MPVTIRYPRNVSSNEAGFNWLARVAHRLNPLWKDTVIFDAQHFGALLREALDNQIIIELGAVRGPVLEVWSKNNFMRQFGGVTLNDEFRTTLAYRQFPLQQNPKSLPATSNMN